MRPKAGGWSVAEILVSVTVLSLGTLVAVPRLVEMRHADRAASAARHVATTLQATRWKAVTAGIYRGLFFESTPDGWVFFEVEDGNGNGLRTQEIRDGVDTKRSGPHLLRDRVRGVRFGFPPGGPYPEIPPDSGVIENTDDPVKFGAADIVSFSPLGAASSGTLYLTDGRDLLYAVVVFGPTVRVRVWRYRKTENRWSL